METEAKDFRNLARAHHAAAGELLAGGDDAQLRHACLELRMALECLAYDLLKLYRDDVEDKVLEMWQAGAILEALREIDPGVEQVIELKVAGEDGGYDQPLLAWREERLDVRWAKKAYHSLGHFLHERTFLEIERGVVHDPAKIRVRAVAIHDEMQKVVESSGWNLRLRHNAKLICDCGGDAHFALSPLQVRSRARCVACGADYDIRSEPSNLASVRSRRTDIPKAGD